MMKIARAIGLSFGRIFGGNELNTGLVRLFEVEYNQEYRLCRRNGVQIDDKFVRAYLETR